MGGTIEADSVQGRGTTFTITLQLLQAEHVVRRRFLLSAAQKHENAQFC